MLWGYLKSLTPSGSCCGKHLTIRRLHQKLLLFPIEILSFYIDFKNSNVRFRNWCIWLQSTIRKAYIKVIVFFFTKKGM